MKWLLLFIAATGFAQSSILPLLDMGDGDIEGAWYKDLTNEFSKFTGTWKYEDTANNTSFTITLQKKEASYISLFNYYQDLLIGEYKYIQNGVEIVNTLPILNNTFSDEYEHNIAGYLIYERYTTNDGERPVLLNFNDPEREYLNVDIYLEYIAPEGGNPAKLKATWTGNLRVVYDDEVPELRVPEQEYILIKQ